VQIAVGRPTMMVTSSRDGEVVTPRRLAGHRSCVQGEGFVGQESITGRRRMRRHGSQGPADAEPPETW
jgi:hypothetical protein